MILNGDIRITTDADEVKSLMFTHRLIFIGEPISELAGISNAISASLFIPPYDVIGLEMDGEIENFINSYTLYLNCSECSDYIALMIRALYQGENILLYLSKDEAETMYSKVLLIVLRDQYGITVANGFTPAMFNEQYSAVICNFLYSHDLMTSEEFFQNYPENEDIQPIPIIINKLMVEMNPYVTEQSLDAYVAYFNNLKRTIKQNNNRYLISLIQLEK